MQLTIAVTPHVLVPVALAAAHGTTDFELGVQRLWPETLPVTPFFLAASTVHFSRDVGAFASLALHATLMCGATSGHIDLMVDLFSAYFCIVHTPMHYTRHINRLRFPVLFTCLFGMGLIVLALPTEVTITDWMQQLVIAHVVCDEIGYD